MNRKSLKGKSLAELNQFLSKEWHPTMNGNLTPFDLTIGSIKKVWWKCNKGDDHEWQNSPNGRSKGSGCPICRNLIIVNSNCLATTNPKLAKQWHPNKNGNLTPFNVSEGSSKKVWWKCDNDDDHEWESIVSARNRGQSCPFCSGNRVTNLNSLKSKYPELLKSWDYNKNNIQPDEISYGSDTKVWWLCLINQEHSWQTTIYNRIQGKSCPFCVGQKLHKSNSLAYNYPELSKEFHPNKNGVLTTDEIIAGSSKKVWWKCDKGNDHEWYSSVVNRIKGNGCPICSGKKTVISNSLATTHPELSKEWHPTKNGDLTPFELTFGSIKKVWWKCNKGDDHEWQNSPNGRCKRSGSGCPICVNQIIVKSNCLATTNPKLAKQWHPNKNENLTPFKISEGSSKKVWWKCDKGDDHEWKTTVSSRNSGLGCPFCTLTPQSKQELTITFELIKFFDINPKGFKTKVNNKLTSIDIFIKDLNLGIEFDGHYWHKDNREFDKLKTQRLEVEGFKIMRIREEPLLAITDIDVISKKPFNAKDVTNNILKHIIEFYSLDAKRIRRIEKYISKENIQNEKGLDSYIDMILTEKANNKKR